MYQKKGPQEEHEGIAYSNIELALFDENILELRVLEGLQPTDMGDVIGLTSHHELEKALQQYNYSFILFWTTSECLLSPFIDTSHNLSTLYNILLLFFVHHSLFFYVSIDCMYNLCFSCMFLLRMLFHEYGSSMVEWTHSALIWSILQVCLHVQSPI